MSHELWDQAHRAFKAHRVPGIDADEQAALNRIAAKCLRISFDETNCTIREEIFDLESLRRLTIFDKKDSSPHRDCEPIVVLSFKGEQYVIDGRRRVNAWLAAGKPQSRRAIVIEPTDAGYAAWLAKIQTRISTS